MAQEQHNDTTQSRPPVTERSAKEMNEWVRRRRPRLTHRPQWHQNQPPKSVAPLNREKGAKSTSKPTAKIKDLIPKLKALKLSGKQLDVALSIIGILQKAHGKGKGGTIICRKTLMKSHDCTLRTIERVFTTLTKNGVLRCERIDGQKQKFSSLTENYQPRSRSHSISPDTTPSMPDQMKGQNQSIPPDTTPKISPDTTPSLSGHLSGQMSGEAPSNPLQHNGSQPPLSYLDSRRESVEEKEDTKSKTQDPSTVGLRASLDGPATETIDVVETEESEIKPVVDMVLRFNKTNDCYKVTFVCSGYMFTELVGQERIKWTVDLAQGVIPKSHERFTVVQSGCVES